MAAGEPLTLNYGERPMRDMLRGYGFTPARASVTDPLEVYENLGDGCQALCIQGSGKVLFLVQFSLLLDSIQCRLGLANWTAMYPCEDSQSFGCNCFESIMVLCRLKMNLINQVMCQGVTKLCTKLMHKIMTFALQTQDEFDQSGDVSGCHKIMHKIDAQNYDLCTADSR